VVRHGAWLEDKFAGELSDIEFPKNGDCFRKTEYQSTNMLNLRRYHFRKRVVIHILYLFVLSTY
jgi:hypothetical protein